MDAVHDDTASPIGQEREKIAALRNTNGRPDAEAASYRAKADAKERKLDQALAATVRNQFTRYVAFHADVCDEEADTLTLWVMHTHAFDATETTPYIAIMAPTEEAGKSKIIDVAQYLVRNSEVVNDPSPASLYRMIDTKHPTL